MNRVPVQGLALLAAVTLVVFVLASGIGTSSIDLFALVHPDDLVLLVRLPRVLLGAMVGAALGVAGVVFQAILRNPLADPYIVGVSGGAALGGVLAIAFEISAPHALPLFAFGGAAGSTVLLFAVARAQGRSDPLTLLLTGVVFNAFAAAAVTFFKAILSATKAQEILFWLMGFVGIHPSATLMMVAAYVLVGCTVALVCSGGLNLLSLGDDEAAALGLPVERVRLLSFLAAALLVATVVAVAGMIGFVGLVVPHILRLLLGADHRFLVPAAALGGAVFLMLSDAAARLSFFLWGTELPVGVVTAFTGGPFFLFLLLRRQD